MCVTRANVCARWNMSVANICQTSQMRDDKCETRSNNCNVLFILCFFFCFHSSIRCSAKKEEAERDSGKMGFIYDIRPFHRLHFIQCARFVKNVGSSVKVLSESPCCDRLWQHYIFFRHCVNCQLDEMRPAVFVLVSW